jgi:peroxiredoxin Q/BCP
MYGRKYMGTARVTFIINETGVIDEIIEKVDTKNHAAQILDRSLTTESAKKVSKPVKKAAPANKAKKVAPKKSKPKKK